jgi:hypothetical protein
MTETQDPMELQRELRGELTREDCLEITAHAKTRKEWRLGELTVAGFASGGPFMILDMDTPETGTFRRAPSYGLLVIDSYDDAWRVVRQLERSIGGTYKIVVAPESE